MRQIGIVLWIAIAIAASGLGWVAWQRHESRLRLEHSVRAGQERGGGRQADDAGTAVRITQFYARAGEITRGELNVICYGVRNARSVRLEPPVERVSPTPARCISIEPEQDTTYTLVAEGDGGERVSESFGVRVKPPPPEILMLATSANAIRRGDAVTLCYGTEHAVAVRLDPLGWALVPGKKNCSRFYPKATATYTLVATGEGGGSERKSFSVEVR